MLHALRTYISFSCCGKKKLRWIYKNGVNLPDMTHVYAMSQCQIQTREAANLHECIYIYTLYEEAALLSN